MIGINGAIGRAMAEYWLEQNAEVIGLCRTDFTMQDVDIIKTDYSESDLQRLALQWKKEKCSFDRIVNAIGVLKTEQITPEKRLKDIDSQSMMSVYQTNTILPTLLIKYFSEFLSKKQSVSVFAHLTAMVGSIEDNRLGGWYSYRASKAALHMIIKTASIEVIRSHKHAAIVAMHPGTTISRLSEPFVGCEPSDKLFTADQTAERLVKLIESFDENDNGGFYHWSGRPLPW